MTPPLGLLTTGAAARELGVTSETVRRWAKSGKIRHLVMPSGQLRFHRHDLEQLLQVAEHYEQSA